MKRIFLLVFFIFMQNQLLNAQDFHPNEIRNQIYDAIIKDIKQENVAYLNKQIWIDPTISVFSNVDLASDGIHLSGPIKRFDTDFCQFVPEVKCVDRIEIDEFKLVKIYQKHVDKENTDFYGIYPPLDDWRSVVLLSMELTLLNDKPQPKEVIIPMKHMYFKQEEVMTTHTFYRFTIDNQYKILKMDKIKFL